MTFRRTAVLTLVAAISSGAAQAEDLTIAVFGGLLGTTLKEAIITPYQTQGGQEIVVDDRDWGIGVVRTRVEGGSNTWDVVNAEDIEVLQGCDEGIFTQIDRSKLPNLEKYIVGDAKEGCGVPMVAYTNAITYDKSKTTEPPVTWADFWNVEKWPGKRSMYKSPRDSLEMALMADGVGRGDVYSVLATPEGVDRAFKKLDELKPNLVWWTNGGQSRQMLASGETSLSATYVSGIYYMNQKEKTDFGVVLNDAITHVDYWAIVNDSPQMENAYKFLQYASEAEAQAGVSNIMAMSVPNGDALALTKPELKPFLSADPDNIKRALVSDSKFWLDNYDSLNKRFEAWLAQ